MLAARCAARDAKRSVDGAFDQLRSNTSTLREYSLCVEQRLSSVCLTESAGSNWHGDVGCCVDSGDRRVSASVVVPRLYPEVVQTVILYRFTAGFTAKIASWIRPRDQW